jgi:Leucine-rich repeat (LRR) protein
LYRILLNAPAFPHQELDLSSCRLKDVDILGAGDLEKLKELVLDNNNLTSFSWVKGLTSLTFLSLNSNRIESFLPPAQNRNNQASKETFHPSGGSLTEMEILYLGHNRIIDLRDLELYNFPNLAVLHAPDNDVSQVRADPRRTVGWAQVLSPYHPLDPGDWIVLVHDASRAGAGSEQDPPSRLELVQWHDLPPRAEDGGQWPAIVVVLCKAAQPPSPSPR